MDLYRTGASLKPMEVVFDVSILAHAVGGINRYIQELLPALRQLSKETGLNLRTLDVPACHPGRPSPIQAEAVLGNPVYMNVPFLRRHSLGGSVERSSRASRLRRMNPDCVIFHHSGVQPACPSNARSVITVHDLSGVQHPEWHTGETVKYAQEEVRLLKGGAFAVTSSEWARDSILSELDLPPERVRSIGGAAGRGFSPGKASREVMNEYRLEPEGYFLHVGNFVPRKNIPMLCGLFSDPESGFRHPLVLAGKGEWGDIALNPSESVRVLRSVPDPHMVHLYRGARALLIPSRYEGLGFPVLEAYACGTGVISSRSAALADTAGNWGVTLDPDDEGGWRREITAADGDHGMNRLREKAAAAESGSWMKVARNLCSFYTEIAGL